MTTNPEILKVAELLADVTVTGGDWIHSRRQAVIELVVRELTPAVVSLEQQLAEAKKEVETYKLANWAYEKDQQGALHEIQQLKLRVQMLEQEKEARNV